MKRLPNEAEVRLALQAILQDMSLYTRRVAIIHKAAEGQHDKTPSRRDCTTNLMLPAKTEEDLVRNHILALNQGGYSLQFSDVKVMANPLLAERPCWKWASTFVKRRPELKVKFNQKNDCIRTKREDSEAIKG